MGEGGGEGEKNDGGSEGEKMLDGANFIPGNLLYNHNRIVLTFFIRLKSDSGPLKFVSAVINGIM